MLAQSRAAKTFERCISRLFSTTQTKETEPHCYMKITRDGEAIGTLTFRLKLKDCPRTVNNFLAICSGENKEKLTYKGSPFHRIVTGFMV